MTISKKCESDIFQRFNSKIHTKYYYCMNYSWLKQNDF